MVTREDIIWAYRAFLNRNPESEAVIGRHMKAVSDMKSLVERVMESQEYRMRFPVHFNEYKDLIGKSDAASREGNSEKAYFYYRQAHHCLLPSSQGLLIELDRAVETGDIVTALDCYLACRRLFRQERAWQFRTNLIWQNAYASLDKVVAWLDLYCEEFRSDDNAQLKYLDILEQARGKDAAKKYLKDILLPLYKDNMEFVSRYNKFSREISDQIALSENLVGLNKVEQAIFVFSTMDFESVNAIDTFINLQEFDTRLGDILKQLLLKKMEIRRTIAKYGVNFISLGTQCTSGIMLANWGLKSGTSGLTIFEQASNKWFDILNLIEADFAGYSQSENIEKRWAEQARNECFVSKVFNTIFIHDSVLEYGDIPTFSSYLDDRIDNFRNIASSSGPVFFICIDQALPIRTDEEIIQANRIPLIEKNTLLYIDFEKSGLRQIANNMWRMGVKRYPGGAGLVVPMNVFTKGAWKEHLDIIDAIDEIIHKRYKPAEAEAARGLAASRDAWYAEIGASIQFKKFIGQIKDKLKGSSDIGCIVMNANPFTFGHLHLVRRAAESVEKLIIFVVEEDKSYFDFKTRYRLVEENVKDIPNVVVAPSGKFIISTTTFPSYFRKDMADLGKIDTAQDVEVFARLIAPQLNIRSRYVGEEPFCKVTSDYNSKMAEILPRHGIEFRKIPRLEIGNEPVSASKVRKLLAQDNWEELAELVPPATFSYLKQRGSSAS